MASIYPTPEKIRLTACVFILPDGRFRRTRDGTTDSAEFSQNLIEEPAPGDAAWRYRSTGRQDVRMNGRLIGRDLIVTRRMPKSPRFAHIPVYVLRHN
jgi:hypothetical protein